MNKSKSNGSLAAARSNQTTRALIDLTIRSVADQLRSNARARAAFLRLVASVRSESDVLKVSTLHGPRAIARIQKVVHVCANVSYASSRWTRLPEDWSCRGGTPMQHIVSLISHLLATHEVPQFMYLVWFTEPLGVLRDDQRLFLHLAGGHSIRGTDSGRALTREMANRFSRAPHHAAVSEAIQFASTGNWLWRKPSFAAGTSRRRRKSTNKPHRNRLTRWAPVAIDGYRHIEETAHPVFGQRTWTIRQLTSRGGLNHEGIRMSHCVGVYWKECVAGETSIWSLERHDIMRTRAILTIEVIPNCNSIVQIKGFANRTPRQHEMEIVRAWASRQSLYLSLS